jgi:phospholipase/carboxylesterase
VVAPVRWQVPPGRQAKLSRVTTWTLKETIVTLELPLPHLYRPADPAAASPWLLVLMHGIGSNEQDLFSLAPHVPPPFHVLSLRAPNTLGPGAYAWFTFDVRPDGRRLIDDAQESASRSVAARAVEEAGRQLAVPPDSRLLPEVLPMVAPIAELTGRRLWVSHGIDDGVIPLAGARDIRDRVAQWSIDLRYAEFPGGHEIRAAELSAAMDWLSSLTRD